VGRSSPGNNSRFHSSNRLHQICNGIKKRLLASLEKAKHAWVDELPSVLWNLRTTPNAATQETPFFWSMAQKPCFQSKSFMKLQELQLTMKQVPQKHSKTTSTHSMNQEM
jgi:hypothetical protein